MASWNSNFVPDQVLNFDFNLPPGQLGTVQRQQETRNQNQGRQSLAQHLGQQQVLHPIHPHNHHDLHPSLPYRPAYPHSPAQPPTAIGNMGGLGSTLHQSYLQNLNRDQDLAREQGQRLEPTHSPNQATQNHVQSHTPILADSHTHPHNHAQPANTMPPLRSQGEFYTTGVTPVDTAAEPLPPGAECTICLEPLTEDVVKMRACGHMFHTVCVLGWFNKSAPCQGRKRGTCPNCRCELYEPDLRQTPTSLSGRAPADQVSVQDMRAYQLLLQQERARRVAYSQLAQTDPTRLAEIQALPEPLDTIRNSRRDTRADQLPELQPPGSRPDERTEADSSENPSSNPQRTPLRNSNGQTMSRVDYYYSQMREMREAASNNGLPTSTPGNPSSPAQDRPARPVPLPARRVSLSYSFPHRRAFFDPGEQINPAVESTGAGAEDRTATPRIQLPAQNTLREAQYPQLISDNATRARELFDADRAAIQRENTANYEAFRRDEREQGREKMARRLEALHIEHERGVRERRNS